MALLSRWPDVGHSQPSLHWSSRLFSPAIAHHSRCRLERITEANCGWRSLQFGRSAGRSSVARHWSIRLLGLNEFGFGGDSNSHGERGTHDERGTRWGRIDDDRRDPGCGKYRNRRWRRFHLHEHDADLHLGGRDGGRNLYEVR